MTEKLYDHDSFIKKFTARVLTCEAEGDRWAVTLDRTAFFPESGGQYADAGMLGTACVLDVRENGADILHYINSPLTVGETVEGCIDWETRFRRMQNHSGEHVLSGIVFRRFGYQNVGFHLADGAMTVDFSGELSTEELASVEIEANRVIAANVPIHAWYPQPAELAGMDYRSKLELTENVRIVEIGEGGSVDRCACCAPHVRRTGEIGSLKILERMRHRGGIRLNVLCGLDALADYGARLVALQRAGSLLSLPQQQVPDGIRRLQEERDALEARISDMERQLLRKELDSMKAKQGNVALFAESGDANAVREAVNELTENRDGIAFAFYGSEGSRRCIIGSRNVNLREAVGDLFRDLGGKGGGKPEMLQGSVTAPDAQIKAYLERYDC